TNEHATNFKVMRAPAVTPGLAHWTEYVTHRDSVLITGLDAFRGHLVVWGKQGGLQGIEVHDLATNETHRVHFPEPVYTANEETNREFDTRKLRFTYQSMVTPPTVVDYDFDARTWSVRKRTEVPHYEPARYATERLW